MTKLYIQIDYTVEDFGRYQTLAAELPSKLRQFGLSSEVIVSSRPVSNNNGKFNDSMLNGLTEKIIEKSKVREDAERVGDWYIHLLVTSAHESASFLGLMYDFKFDARRRQGCAIFEKAILNSIVGDVNDFQRVMLRTVLHEVGHCFNLVHRKDLSVMCQTSRLMESVDWPNNIEFDFAKADLDFVRQNPKESRPGGSGVRMIEVGDIGRHIKDLRISVRPFRDRTGRDFTCGARISLLLKIHNRSSQSISFHQPLDIQSENVEILFTAPGEAPKKLIPPIVACGNGQDKIAIQANSFRYLPIYLFASREGYLFGKEGRYSVKIGLRDANDIVHFARKFSFNVRLSHDIDNQIVKEEISKADIIGFMTFGGDGSAKTRARVEALLANQLSPEIEESLLWNLVRDIRTTISMKIHVGEDYSLDESELATAYRRLMTVESSQIRRGRVINELRKIQWPRDATVAIPPSPHSALSRYREFEKKCINEQNY